MAVTAQLIALGIALFSSTMPRYTHLPTPRLYSLQTTKK
jgi:hypothetical protein